MARRPRTAATSHATCHGHTVRHAALHPPQVATLDRLGNDRTSV